MGTSKFRPNHQRDSGLANNSDPELRDLIGYRIRRLNMLLTQHSKALNHQTNGLTLAQSRVLYELGINGASRPWSIAESAGLERSHVTQATRELITRRLISKTADPSDGRSVLLSLTASGKAALNRGIAASAARRELLDAALTEEERHVFHDALSKLTDVAEKLLQDFGDDNFSQKE